MIGNRLMRHVFLAFIFIISVAASHSALSVTLFVVDDIRVEGLQRISAGTVFNYLPLKIGDSADEHTISKSIRELYKTGFLKMYALNVKAGH